MRKHPLHGVVIAALLGTSFIHQRPSAHHPHPSGPDIGRTGLRLASAALPGDAGNSGLAPGEGPSAALVQPVTDLDHLGIRLAAAAVPADAPLIPVVPGEANNALLRPVRTRYVKELSALFAYEQAHTPPPPPPAATIVVATPTPHPVGTAVPPATRPAAGDVWAGLRQCESNGNYADNTGNGYYGAYQFSLATWRGLGLPGLPSDAPPAVQDQAARSLQARSGWGQWPTCSRRLRLI
jgi:hypothetical protein